jgi:hypothetical protein
MLTCHARSDDVTARPLPDFRRHIVIVNDNLYIRTWREPGPARRRRRCVSFSFLFDIEEFDFFFTTLVRYTVGGPLRLFMSGYVHT